MKTFSECLTFETSITNIPNSKFNNDYYYISEELFEIFDMKKPFEKILELDGNMGIYTMLPSGTRMREFCDLNHKNAAPRFVNFNYFLQNNPKKDFSEHYLVLIDQLIEKSIGLQCVINVTVSCIECTVKFYEKATNKYYFNNIEGLMLERRWSEFIVST